MIKVFIPALVVVALGLVGCGASKDRDSGTVGGDHVRGGGEYSSPVTREQSVPGVQGDSTRIGWGRTGSATGGANGAVGQGSVGTPDHESY